MKTILVVYTNTALTAKQISDKKMQKLSLGLKRTSKRET